MDFLNFSVTFTILCVENGFRLIVTLEKLIAKLKNSLTKANTCNASAFHLKFSKE